MVFQHCLLAGALVMVAVFGYQRALTTERTQCTGARETLAKVWGPVQREPSALALFWREAKLLPRMHGGELKALLDDYAGWLGDRPHRSL